jgi:hypothetical protein
MKLILLFRLYRPLMRLAHHFDWHYMPTLGPFEDGSTQRWCQWCGLREKMIEKKVFGQVRSLHE